MYIEPSLFPPFCMVQRPGFSTRSRSGNLSGFTGTACTPSLASNGRLCVKQRSPQDSQPAQQRVHLASGAVALAGHNTKMYACPMQSSSASSEKESTIMVLQESITKTRRRGSFHRQESAISYGSRRPQTETVDSHQ